MWPFGAKKVACAGCGQEMEKGSWRMTLGEIPHGFATGSLALRCSGCKSYWCGACVVAHSVAQEPTDDVDSRIYVVYRVTLGGEAQCPSCGEWKVGLALMQ